MCFLLKRVISFFITKPCNGYLKLVKLKHKGILAVILYGIKKSPFPRLELLKMTPMFPSVLQAVKQ
jgi:hypothetical protein